MSQVKKRQIEQKLGSGKKKERLVQSHRQITRKRVESYAMHSPLAGTMKDESPHTLLQGV
jgi:hypothetical protein